MLVDRVIEQWLNAGVELRPGAPCDAIRAVERLLGAALPDDARAFYEKANGMRDFAYDRWFVSIWSCERLISEHEVQRGSDARGAYMDVSFADVMISSWYFWFRVREDGSVSVFVESIAQELATFSFFLSRYLEDPESVGLCEVGQTPSSI